MRDSMRYVNHNNEVINFGSANILINENDFRNYEWTFNSLYNRITSFERKIRKNTLPVIVVGSDAKTVANNIFEIIEKDVLTTQAGRMYIGDHYLTGFFYASSKKEYTTDGVIQFDLTFVSDQGFWIKEFPYIYRVNMERSGGDKGLGYSYGYPYGFNSPISSQNLVNASFVPSNAIITIYGYVINPKVIIGGNVYQVLTTVNAGEQLVINTKEKSAIVISSKGEKRSVYALRNLESYLFEKVKTGTSKVICDPDFNFNVTLLEERSEPAWI